MWDNSRIGIFILMVLLVSCGQPKKAPEKPLIYEGMPSKELLNILGNPLSIDSSGRVFNAELREIQKMETWAFPNRIVLIINDTVKDPSL